jgi:acyl-CoA reductase-like NAD-dependent aldehyde dehydrogenase
MFINGKFTKGKSKERIPVINPATEEILEEVPRGTSEDSLAAVEAASASFPGWMRAPANERAAALHQVASKLREYHDEIVELLTTVGGGNLRLLR